MILGNRSVTHLRMGENSRSAIQLVCYSTKSVKNIDRTLKASRQEVVAFDKCKKCLILNTKHLFKYLSGVKSVL